MLHSARDSCEYLLAPTDQNVATGLYFFPHRFAESSFKMPNAMDAMQLASYGWRVHPLKTRSKRPELKAWQKAATTDEDVIAEWWERHPDANIGVAMGPDSGIVSLDCDSDEAEKFLVELFDGNEIVTPVFQTARGKQYLFRYTSDLPNSDKANWKLSGLALDFKIGNGKGSYCVFPPSVHPDGPQYRWLVHPDDVDVAELPDEVIAKLCFYASEGSLDTTAPSGRPAEYWERIKDGVGSGERNNAAASIAGKHVSAMIDPTSKNEQNAVLKKLLAWNSGNVPPLDETELRRTFHSILTRHLDQIAATKFTQPIQNVDEQAALFHGWSMTRIDASPPYYKLRSPLWEGEVELQDEDVLNAYRVRQAVLTQKCEALEPEFKKFWDGGKGRPGCMRFVVSNCKREAPAFDECREYVLAGHIHSLLMKAKVAESPSASGNPVKIGDSVWFRLDYWRQVDRFIADNDFAVAKLLKPLCRDKRHKADGNYLRCKVISSKGLEKLSAMALYGTEE